MTRYAMTLGLASVAIIAVVVGFHTQIGNAFADVSGTVLNAPMAP